MSYTLFLFITFSIDFVCMLYFCCIFVPQLYRHLKVDKVTLIKIWVVKLRIYNNIRYASS